MALVLVGCGAAVRPTSATTVRTSTPAKTSSLSDSVGPVVVLRNAAPGALAISLAVTFDQSIGDTQQMVEVGLDFDSHGASVQFAGDERVTCNGVDLPLKNRLATFQVVRAPASQLIGTTVRCDYASGGSVASVALQIPTPPTITSPQPGAQIARGAQTLVTYREGSAMSTLLGIVALAPSSPSPKALARMNTPGPLQATIDTSGFAPGPGSFVLTASLTPHITAGGTPFASVGDLGSATSTVPVKWV